MFKKGELYKIRHDSYKGSGKTFCFKADLKTNTTIESQSLNNQVVEILSGTFEEYNSQLIHVWFPALNVSKRVNRTRLEKLTDV